MSDPELYQRLAERHGHYCPMSTLGVRLGEEALRRLSAVPEGGLELRYLARTCAADGIRILFETADYPQDFQVEPLGQHRFSWRVKGDRELSLQLTEEALQLAAGYRNLAEDEQPKRLELLRTAPAERLIAYIEGPSD